MCTGSRGSNPFATLLGVNRPSPYASNYGYGKTGSTSPISDAERQWYIANSFGDPLAITGATAATPASLSWSKLSGGNVPIYRKATAANPGYYRGVSPEARMLYTTAADRAKAVSDASAQYAQERVNSTSVRASDEGVRYNYAGAALGIPG
jgi:hypothetical protein